MDCLDLFERKKMEKIGGVVCKSEHSHTINVRLSCVKPEVSWSLGLLTSLWLLHLLLPSRHPLQLQRRLGVLPQLSAAGTRFAAVERLLLIHPLVGVC